ncbi:hypothetical protein EDB81DRAFT_827308 [Dactylonectria macrodidyma]|uniref:Uncharacterized protein n=1 Tax=Dactylonectria macrodidyma TaxID=307937 RepID=A0A9P9D5C2_9HYPO|nr:hypothetical protein EDB81DRAFT_829062 [Dactylonectria macrodidyma]KAH7112691.1 hypothetical protein EDB81DRAFT_827308 [Dactylonectria macrodidyma]
MNHVDRGDQLRSYYDVTGSHVGSYIRTIGNGESAFITHYSTPTVMKVSQGRDIAQGRNWTMRAPKHGQLSIILSVGRTLWIAYAVRAFGKVK